MDLIATILITFTESLARIDRSLFIFIHKTASSPLLDWFFMLMRNALTWIPLYAFLLYWIIRNKKRYAWQFVFFSLLVFTVTDFTSASILKPLFQRTRPCFDADLMNVVRDLVGCGGKYGMPSTHASNHFGFASFWFLTITWMSNRKWYWLWIWALLIGYSQVYVGKHFPGDVLVGAVLGICVGTLFAVLFRKWLLDEKIVITST